MNPPRQLKVYMQLGPAQEPIRGEVEAPSGERTAFSGWIGLVATIEAARTPPPVEAHPTAGGDGQRETGPTKALLVPGDEVVFRVFAARSPGTVREASLRAGVEFERVLESVPVGIDALASTPR